MKEQLKNDELLNWQDEVNKNHLQTIEWKHKIASRYKLISAYILNQDIDGLTDFLSENIDPIMDEYLIESKLPFDIRAINNKLIENSIIGLHNSCESRNIKLTIDVSPIKHTIDMSANDLLSVIGIFAENALQEACGLDDAEIEYYVKQFESVTVIRISNTYNDLKSPKNKDMFEMEFWKKRHGKGFVIVKKITEPYSNIRLRTEKYNLRNMYVQEIAIELVEQGN